MYKDQKITVVIPCLNEEQGIEQVLRRMPTFVDQVIVVDNGSTDRTSEVAREFGAEVIREDVRGYGRSYKRGFASATGDIIVTLDGDHSYPPDALSYLIEALLHLDADFLNASRFPVRDRRAMSFKHKFGNWVLSFAQNWCSSRVKAASFHPFVCFPARATTRPACSNWGLPTAAAKSMPSPACVRRPCPIRPR